VAALVVVRVEGRKEGSSRWEEPQEDMCSQEDKFS
jgi:hypothetical protein